ncbi:MAG: proton-conducting transporter membrane subunit [Phycisphaerae bacterium]
MIHHPSFVFLVAILALIVAGCINYRRPEKTGIAPSVISITALAMAVGLSMGGLAWKLGHIGGPVSSVTSGLIIHWLRIPGGYYGHKRVWIDLGIRSDTLGVAFFMTVLLIALLGHIHLSASTTKSEPKSVYYAFSIWALAAMLMAFLAVSVLQLLAFVLLAALMGWLMLMLSRDEPVSGPGLLAAGPLLIPIGLAGASLALVAASSATGGLHWLAGGAPWPKTGTVMQMHTRSAYAGGSVAGILVGFGVLGFGAQIPFQIWPHEYSKSAPSSNYLLMSSLILGAAPFLAERLKPFFTLDARLFIAIAAAATALMAALGTLEELDIRQVLAGLSSAIAGMALVFMMTGSSAAGLTLSLIGLLSMTGLMMVSGTVIHSTDREADISRLGGLWRRLPLSAIFSLLLIVVLTGGLRTGTCEALRLGLANLHSYAAGLGLWGRLLYGTPVVAIAVITVSLLRWWWRIFIIKPRSAPAGTARESPLQTFPPLILLVGSLTAGMAFLDLPLLIHRALSHREMAKIALPSGAAGWVITYIPWMVAGALILVALAYSRGDATLQRLLRIPGINLINRWLKSNMYVADMYGFILARPIRLISIVVAVLDQWISGWLIVMLALGTGALGLLVATVDGIWTLRWWPAHGRRMPPPIESPSVPPKNSSQSAT